MAKFGDGGELLKCSFCGKSQHEVRKLIAGPTVFICDECVELCMEIIREENKTSFMKSREESKALATSLVNVAKANGLDALALPRGQQEHHHDGESEATAADAAPHEPCRDDRHEAQHAR